MAPRMTTDDAVVLKLVLVVGVVYNHFLSAVHYEAPAKKVVELNVLTRQPLLYLEEVEPKVALVRIV